MTKIHKLLYISYGIFLARENKRLTNEHPQAWPFGPVFPRVHNKVSLDIPPVSVDSLKLPEIAKKRFVRYWMSLANFLQENSPHGLIRPIVLGIEP